MVRRTRMLLWSIDETSGFDSAWSTLDDRTLRAEGRSGGLAPRPYWVSYVLETADDFVHRRISVESRWADGAASLDLRRGDDGGWTVNGEARPDLDEALDCDLAACPLTNSMPILRHALHREAGDASFLMAFIELPDLTVVTSPQRYTHLRRTADGGALIHFASGSFESELTIDGAGFVVDYPKLGRLVQPGDLAPGIRAAGPGSARPG